MFLITLCNVMNVEFWLKFLSRSLCYQLDYVIKMLCVYSRACNFKLRTAVTFSQNFRNSNTNRCMEKPLSMRRKAVQKAVPLIWC
jgi:hypothetical protein